MRSPPPSVAARPIACRFRRSARAPCSASKRRRSSAGRSASSPPVSCSRSITGSLSRCSASWVARWSMPRGAARTARRRCGRGRWRSPPPSAPASTQRRSAWASPSSARISGSSRRASASRPSYSRPSACSAASSACVSASGRRSWADRSGSAPRSSSISACSLSTAHPLAGGLTRSIVASCCLPGGADHEPMPRVSCRSVAGRGALPAMRTRAGTAGHVAAVGRAAAGQDGELAHRLHRVRGPSAWWRCWSSSARSGCGATKTS
eukprot:284815161_2